MKNNSIEIHNHRTEPWIVTMLYTGQKTKTGGRLLRARNILDGERFMLTYGDGVGDVNIPQLLEFHEKSNKALTMTTIQPAGKYGSVMIEPNGIVSSFLEKPQGDGGWINGGFFVAEPSVFDYLHEGDQTVFEKEPLEKLASDGKIAAFKHTGFWKCMDTLKDKNALTKMWYKGNAPWKIWRT